MSSNQQPQAVQNGIFTLSDIVETQRHSEQIYEGRVIKLRVDEAELPDGTRVRREVVDHPGGVVVLPQLSDGRILFVEQFRYALGHPLLELPAGKLDPGELPEVAIKRELQEETGYYAQHWESLGRIVTSPGFCNETLWLFKATGLFPADDGALFDQEERILCHHLTLQEATAAVHEGRIIDAKTICMLWWLMAAQ